MTNLKNTYRICYFCRETKSLIELFRCWYCQRVCCSIHNEDNRSVCPRCDNEEEEIYRINEEIVTNEN